METEKENWNNFVKDNGGSFLQSWQWGEFQKSLDRKVWRLEQADQFAALIIKNSLPFGKSYLYCPYGPILKNSQSFELFLNIVKEIAQGEGAIFLKIEPNKQLEENNLIKSNVIQPQKTIILDITGSSDKILEQMHKKTRYNIKLAQKKGIRIDIIDAPQKKDITAFVNLSDQTARRDRFNLHPKEYYESMLTVLSQEGLVKLITAQLDGQIIAANIILFFNSTAIYLHGASDYNFRQLMAPYLLQWHSILKAQELGYKKYDFWGIDERKWPGVTRFKEGFGGQPVIYSGAYDHIYRSNWYRVYNLAKKIR